MPVYDYLCEKGHEFESKRSVDQAPPPGCYVHVPLDPPESASDGLEVVKRCGAPVKLQLSAIPGRVAGGTPRYHR